MLRNIPYLSNYLILRGHVFLRSKNISLGYPLRGGGACNICNRLNLHFAIAAKQRVKHDKFAVHIHSVNCRLYLEQLKRYPLDKENIKKKPGGTI